MNDVKAYPHSKWRCKYHGCFVYESKTIYGRIKADGKRIRKLIKKKKKDYRGRMLSRSYSYVSYSTII